MLKELKDLHLFVITGMIVEAVQQEVVRSPLCKIRFTSFYPSQKVDIFDALFYELIISSELQASSPFEKSTF